MLQESIRTQANQRVVKVAQVPHSLRSSSVSLPLSSISASAVHVVPGKMGNKSSLMLQEQDIRDIQAETGCEYLEGPGTLVKLCYFLKS